MKLLKPLLFVLTPVLLSGCYSSSEAFWDKAAKLNCENLQECNKANFEATYSSMSDCVDTVREDNIDLTSTCEYDAEQGRECIKVTKKYKGQCDINAAELDEILRACEDTHYSCGNGLGFGLDPESGQTYITSFDPSEVE